MGSFGSPFFFCLIFPPNMPPDKLPNFRAQLVPRCAKIRCIVRQLLLAWDYVAK